MERVKSISKSMVSYLKRARQHKEFLLKETREFERGKRHLAAMMGIDSSEMTQDDVDKAIKYLFPSGLFEKKARPAMKHPDLIFKSQKEAQFDVEGRPHHYLFYTGLPNYYEALSTISNHYRNLNQYEDEQLAKGIVTPPVDSQYSLAARDWISQDSLSYKFLEKIKESDYNYFIQSLEKLKKHPYSNRVANFIEDFTYPLKGQSVNLQLPEIIHDEETGQIYAEMITQRRATWLKVKTILNGSGKFDFEGHDILYFEHPMIRRAIYHPLSLTGMQDQVDIIAKIHRSPRTLGYTAVAGCIRYGVSCALAAYVDADSREKLRISGLLACDTRVKERKKFGQEGARRKYTWKKR